MQPHGAVRLDDISVTYPAPRRGGRPVVALSELSLALPRGTVIGLVGANGAGKTSLLEVLAGALTVTSGTVDVSDGRGMPLPPHRIGFAPDVPRFPDELTSREALALFAGISGITPQEANARLQALEVPLELSALLDRRVGGLSRGNLQKVGLAQALLRAPDLLLCDEPFGALDPVVQVGLRGVLQAESARGACIVVSSHQLDQVEKVADRVLVIDGGRLVADLTAQELRAGWLMEVECVGASEGFETALRERWSFVVRKGDVFTLPWGSPTPVEADLARALPAGCPAPVIRRVVPVSLESLLLAALRRN